METYADLEPMAQADLRVVARGIGAVPSMICRLNEADLTRGKARISHGRCFWLKDGTRVSIVLTPDGGHVAAPSDKPDPTAPATGTFKVT